jgi:hypothetical protein
LGLSTSHPSAAGSNVPLTSFQLRAVDVAIRRIGFSASPRAELASAMHLPKRYFQSGLAVAPQIVVAAIRGVMSWTLAPSVAARLITDGRNLTGPTT